MSPAVARHIELVPFPENTVSATILKNVGLTELQHSLLLTCGEGRAVNTCTVVELRRMHSLEREMLVKRSKDQQWWYVTMYGERCLEYIAIATQERIPVVG